MEMIDMTIPSFSLLSSKLLSWPNPGWSIFNKVIQRGKDVIASRILLPVLLFFCMSVLAASAIYMVVSGCFYIQESAYLLNHYLSGASALWKIFYTPGTEGFYSVFRARELSYFFNWLDAQAIRICFQAGVPHFLSITYFLSLICVGIIHVRYSVQCFDNDRQMLVVSILMYVAYLLSPTVFYSTQYFRTGKILAGLFVFWQGWILFSEYLKTQKQSMPENRETATFLYLLVSTLAGLSDEQGLFLTFMLHGALVYMAIISKVNNARKFLIAALVSFLILLFYRLFLGQAAIASITGLDIRRFDPKFKDLNWSSTLSILKHALELLLQYLSNLLGQMRLSRVGLLFAIAFSGMFYRIFKHSKKDMGSLLESVLKSPVLIMVYVFLMIWGMLFIMTIDESLSPRFQFRSPYVAIPFLRMWYYPLPLLSLFIVGVTALAYYFSRFASEAGKYMLICAVVMVAAGNLHGLPEGHRVLRSQGIARPYVAQYIIFSAFNDDSIVVKSEPDPIHSRYMRSLIMRMREYLPRR